MGGSGFRVFDQPADGEIRFELDFSHRQRLDELTWEAAGRLPRIATLHPNGSGDVDVTIDAARGYFFDVGPKHWELDSILELLREVAGEVEIAVLPELCLPNADELAEALAASPGDYPPLIVAGSAHVRSPGATHERRSNESRIYLDGEEVGAARKCHPFATKTIGEQQFSTALVEGITGEQKTVTVLGSNYTHLGVVICSDLIDDLIPKVLVTIGVNLLLVPSFSRSIGGFEGTTGAIADHCQGVAAVANAQLDGADRGRRGFLVSAAVPHVGALVGHLVPDGVDPRPQIAIIDPNKPMPDAVNWHSSAAESLDTDMRETSGNG
jgi:predicted amidohydrolase